MKQGMLTVTQRVASFQTKPRRRSSVSTGNKKSVSFKWPHLTLNPQILAEAGFYYNPVAGSEDNVTCYLCQKNLDGWEEDDDPAAEHVRHSKQCGWAIAFAILQNTSDLVRKPHDPSVIQARFNTYGSDLWPHEGSENLNTASMVNSGFFYTPTEESSDSVFCPFCQVELGDWGADDIPWHEHQRRAPDCLFIMTNPPKKKGRRPIRTSMQSVSDDVIAHMADDEEPEQPIMKKPSRTKAAAGAKKGRGKKTARSPSVESILDHEEPAAPQRRGRKRASNVPHEPIVVYDGSKTTDEELEDPPPPRPKRRNTRQSSVQSIDVDQEFGGSDGVESAPKRRGRRATNSKTAPSPMMSAKKRTYLPTDEDIERVLAMELDQPLADEEAPVTYQKPFVRQPQRTTRSRTSILVEQQLKDAPDHVLIPTAGRSPTKTVAKDAGMMKAQARGQLKSFFKNQQQDFTMPIKVPDHLSRPSSPREGLGDNEPLELAREPVAKKGRGRVKRANEEVEVVVDPKPKRGKATRAGKKTTRTAGSRSNTVETFEAQVQALSMTDSNITPTIPTEEDPIENTSRSSIRAPQRMKRAGKSGQKKTAGSVVRTSIDSLASTVPDEPMVDCGADVTEYDSDSGNVVRPEGSAAQPNETTSARYPFDHKANESAVDTETIAEQPASNTKSKTTKGKRTTAQKGSRKPPVFSPPSTVDTDIVSLTSEVVCDGADIAMLDASSDHSQAQPGPEKRIVAFTIDEIKSPESEPVEPVQRSSPPQKQVQSVPERTPSPQQKPELSTTAPWVPIRLDVVFSPLHQESQNGLGLTTPEKDMTVEEWLKWNGDNAQRRHREQGEKTVALFEQKGREAIAAIDGIITH